MREFTCESECPKIHRKRQTAPNEVTVHSGMTMQIHLTIIIDQAPKLTPSALHLRASESVGTQRLALVVNDSMPKQVVNYLPHTLELPQFEVRTEEEFREICRPRPKNGVGIDRVVCNGPLKSTTRLR